MLLSGGLDSAIVLAMAREQGLSATPVGGLRPAPRGRARAAAAIAEALGAHEHRVMRVDLAQIGGSALTDPPSPCPKRRASGIPVTYVPARNTIMLSLALGWAEVLDAREIHWA